MLSLLIPVFNEQEAIEDTVREAHSVLSRSGERFEIVVIDDGSTDATPKLLRELNLHAVQVVRHPENRGYGSAMKTGIRRSSGDLIATVDADGTYPIGDFPRLLTEMHEGRADMVVGARTKRGAKVPLIRRPAKAIVSALANTLAGQRIPDLNSGMRIFTRELAERFLHLYPQGFSFTITITLAALTNEHTVRYVPIEYHSRKGRSTLRGFNGIRNFVQFLGLIVRIITSFRPLTFFAWPSVALGLAGIATIAYTIWKDANISDTGLLLTLTGLQIGLFGLLAEIVVRQRQR
jgi:glycosyltransferase involved in cell wall biosynthesis